MLHMWLYSMALLLPDSFPKIKENQEIEVVYQNETTLTTRKYFVPDYSNEEEKLDLLKKAVNRLSRVTRRVKEEVQARQGSTTQNSQPMKAPNLREKILNDLKSQNNNKPLENTIDDPNAPSINKRMQDRVASNTQLSDSTISNYIPDVRSGGFSSLNSDQFVFYTFYARINEQVRNRWINNIRHFLNVTPQTEINRLASRPQNSQLEIILAPNGQFIKAIIHQKSENRLLDESAIASFRQASPLNNPPEEMIEEDGYIHLRYIFTLHFRPSYIASGSGQ
jgi:TonB family protein